MGLTEDARMDLSGIPEIYNEVIANSTAKPD
jgi:L-amino acid N-acyltransferase YncA